jgi:RNA polymerase sigma factor (sigma-70 family)
MEDHANPDRREFATTHWSLVAAAKPDEKSQSRARKALEELCSAYWYPLYAFVRNRGYSANDAQDLTQSFFLQLIESKGFGSADPERGRFRSYLLGAMKHFLANQWHKTQAQKRGGSVGFLELDALAPEARYALEPTETTHPDEGFDRKWAQELIARAMENLRVESGEKGKGQQFDALKSCLVGDEGPRDQIAASLGMTKGSVKVAVHRLRQRYRELVRAEIAETLSDPSEIDDEMRYLLAALRKN